MRLRIFAALAAFLVLCAPALATSYVVLPDGTSFPVLARRLRAAHGDRKSRRGAADRLWVVRQPGSGHRRHVGHSDRGGADRRRGDRPHRRDHYLRGGRGGRANSAVTFAGAGQIPAGGALTLNTTAAVYGIVGSGSTTCNAWETF